MTIEILQGDCLEVIASLEPESFHACVTDPPYHLVSQDKRPATRQCPHAHRRVPSGGFMGQAWDGGDVAFRPETWAAVYRVLKPGAHLLAFGGTRTFHRLACAIEDAGFEIRDTIMWLYGCLSEDTEILTADGWKLGTSVEVSERIAAWNPATGSITLERVQETFCAPWSGDLVRFVNDDTDQLLTPNHRVYHRPSKRQMTACVRARWYEDQWECADATEINRWNTIKLPCAGLHDGAGIGGEDYAALLGWIWTEGGFDKSGSGVRIYQSASANPTKTAEIDALVSRVVPSRKRYDRERTYTYGNTVRQYEETCWFFSGEVAARVRADLPGKRPSWPLLWSMTLAEKRAFWDAAMKGDGCDFQLYQRDRENLEWAQALLTTMGMRGKIATRSAPRTGGSLCITPRDSTELQARHLRHASAPYVGKVWCVRVPTGAFVARRNGKVFVTGNSGFPKSLDVSKAIDRKRDDYEDVCRVALWLRPHIERAGFDVVTEHFGFKDQTMARARWTSRSQPQVPAWHQWLQLKTLCGFCDEMDAEVWRLNGRKGQPGEAWFDREVIGHTRAAIGLPGHSVPEEQKRIEITASATEAARQWQGWGTALKPACEPIVVARKPLSEGTVAAQVLATGTGALNIDACRVATAPEDLAAMTGRSGKSTANNVWGDGIGGSRDSTWQPPQGGRWPANVCHDGSPEVLDAFARFGERPTNSGDPFNRNPDQARTAYGKFNGTPADGYYGDTGTSARFFKTCGWSAEELEDASAVAQSGFSRDNGGLFEEPSCTENASTAGENSPLDLQMSGAVSGAFVVDTAGELPSESRRANRPHQGPSANATGAGIDNGARKAVAEPASNSNPDGCGSENTAQFQTDTTCTTRTTTDPTTGLRTSSCNQSQSITPTIRSSEPGTAWTMPASEDAASGATSGNRSPSSIPDETEPTVDTASHAEPNISGSGAQNSNQARFHFCGKASADERVGQHPTVKPLSLMIWLCQLVCPPGGKILDPFAGTGSTLVACDHLGFDSVGIEQDAQTVADAHEKIRRMRARRMIGDVTDRAIVPQGQLGLFD